MSAIPINLPPRVSRGEGVSAAWANSIREAIARLAARKHPRSYGSGGGGGSSTCQFGELIDVDSGGFTKAIRGGVMICGDKNFNVPFRGINLASPGSWLIYLELTGVDPQTDDDDELILPGVKTASGTPSWEADAYTGSENYPDTTNPTTPAGTGTIIVPIGILTVADGAASFSPAGCGNITVGQCAGILSYTRGTV